MTYIQGVFWVLYVQFNPLVTRLSALVGVAHVCLHPSHMVKYSKDNEANDVFYSRMPEGSDEQAIDGWSCSGLKS